MKAKHKNLNKSVQANAWHLKPIIVSKTELNL